MSGEAVPRAPGAISADRAKLLELLLSKKTNVRPQLRRIPRETGSVSRLPASWAQESLWFISQLEGSGAAYNIAITLRFSGTLREDALLRALDTLVERHEVLRTVFVELEGELRQQLATQARFNLREVDLSGAESGERRSQVQLQQSEEAQEPFNLYTGPLIRGRLLRLDTNEHLLLITVHHIVSDGWSVGLMARELVALYEAHCDGRDPSLPPLAIQYADYAQWQKQWLRGSSLQRQLNHWLVHLQGVTPELELPTDRPRPATQGYRGESVRVTLSAALTMQLNALARRHEMTLFMILYAGLAMVLGRLSGQEDVVIGTPVTNRRRPELEGLIGLFVNTLPLRVPVSPAVTLQQFLARVKDVTLAAYDNQDVPFEQIVEALRPPRSLNRHPIFQVMLVLKSQLPGPWRRPELDVTLEEGMNLTSKFDLLLSLELRDEQIVGSINFDRDLFDRQTVARWVACYVQLLESMRGDLSVSIGDLPMLVAAERRQVVQSFNAVHAACDQEQLIHHLFEEQVRRTPTAVALVSERQQLSYAELDAKASELASILRGRGIGPDDLVGICVERSPEMVFAMLGILKAGGAYVPLDPSYPAERLAYMLEDAAPKVLLIQSRLRGILPAMSAEVIALDELWEQSAANGGGVAVDASTPSPRPSQLAYVIYTSGSTGQPKGVMVEHRNVVGLWRGLEDLYEPFASCRRIAVNASFNFDSSVKQFIQLLSGRSIVLVPEQCRADAWLMLKFLDDNRINGVDCTPSQLRSWLAAGLCAQERPWLQVVLVGGEAIDAELWSTLAQQPALRFINVYGPTECTVDATAVTLSAGTRTPHIGRPMQNRRVYILDPRGQPVPIGVVGEIHIGGGGVARGYLRRAALTAQRFLPDAFSVDAQARMYRTGDLGRWRPDGTIEYHGRNDQQVKIRGFRIEVGEIEEQLSGYPAIKAAVVIPREDVPGEKRLVAYLVAREQMQLQVEDVKRQLRAALPEYLVPSGWVVLESMPLTPSGKLDRRALPKPDLAAYSSDVYEAPEAAEEQTLAEIWRELLHVERVGRQDHFFQLGGHSLLAVKMLFKVNQSFGLTLRVTDLYRNPTLQELAARIRGHHVEDDFVDLMREAALDTAVQVPTGPRRISGHCVLLTGGTGFVGRFLLAQLLVDTEATVYCLVRASSQRQAAARLRATLVKWNLWRDEFERRVVAIPGELAAPNLGIDDASYRMLCDGVDTIYHCATSMNHLETYAMAKLANVQACRELVRLASTGRVKLINYISTLSIFSLRTTSTDRVVSEASPIEQEKHLSSEGYVASKWVGEKIFMVAGEQGIPCNIFRLGLIWADTQQGRYDELQRDYRVFKSSLLSGIGIENYQYRASPTPVDFAARAIVLLSNQHIDGDGIFHIAATGQGLGHIFERVNEVADASLQLLPYYDWICAMKRLHEQGRSLPVVPLIEYAFGMDQQKFQEHQQRTHAASIRFDCQRTHRELERAGLVAPVLSDELLLLGVKDMIARDPQLQGMLSQGSGQERLRKGYA